MRALSVSLLLVVSLPVADARAQNVEGVEIVEWGIYRADRVGALPSPSSPSGTSNLAANIRLQQTTTTVPALVGMTFGLRYKVLGSRSGRPLNLKLVMRFPKQGVTNPATGKTFASAEYDTTAIVGAVSWEGYSLDYEWEVETGPWTMEVWHDGRKLAEKTFMVTRLVSSAR
jgi:hypothetical protein